MKEHIEKNFTKDHARVQVAHDKVGQALNVAGAFYAQGYHDAMTDHNLVERKRGEWVKVGESCGVDLLECPVCHTIHAQDGDAFCRDCGADMRGEKHEAD